MKLSWTQEQIDADVSTSSDDWEPQMQSDMAKGIEGIIELKARAQQRERRVYELEVLAEKLLAYCDAATHQDMQYHDERERLIETAKYSGSTFRDVADALKGLVAAIGELPENGAGVLQGLKMNRAYMMARHAVEWHNL